jgi:hypothetical protein
MKYVVNRVMNKVNVRGLKRPKLIADLYVIRIILDQYEMRNRFFSIHILTSIFVF